MRLTPQSREPSCLELPQRRISQTPSSIFSHAKDALSADRERAKGHPSSARNRGFRKLNYRLARVCDGTTSILLKLVVSALSAVSSDPDSFVDFLHERSTLLRGGIW